MGIIDGRLIEVGANELVACKIPFYLQYNLSLVEKNAMSMTSNINYIIK